MACRVHIPALRFTIYWMFFFVHSTHHCRVVDVGLCSLGTCGKHTLMYAETEGGQEGLSCTRGRDEEPFGRCHIQLLAASADCFVIAIK